jgi:hypothetical protein
LGGSIYVCWNIGANVGSGNHNDVGNERLKEHLHTPLIFCYSYIAAIKQVQKENTMEDKSIMIKTCEGSRIIHIDQYDDELLWINIQLNGGGAGTPMTKSQAKDMISALMNIVNYMEQDNGNS